MKYGLSKYKFASFKDGNGKLTISARSTYAGKTVKGYAKCDPRDEYDVEAGKELAAARCNERIAQKRVKRAAKQVEKAKRLAAEAQAYQTKMEAYYRDAVQESDEAINHVQSLLEKM